MSASGAVLRLSLFYQRKRQTQVQISLIKIFYRLLNLDGHILLSGLPELLRHIGKLSRMVLVVVKHIRKQGFLLASRLFLGAPALAASAVLLPVAVIVSMLMRMPVVMSMSVSMLSIYNVHDLSSLSIFRILC